VTEREWREASDMRRSVFTLAAIVAVAAVLRFWALGAGIPYSIGVDEPELMNRAVQMMRTGDFNPRFFDYPGLYIHMQLVVASLRFLVGATAGKWQSLTQVAPTDFYLWGRALTALLGTATVFLVYLIGMRWGTRYAALAAGLLAVMPIHVRESHYILTDVPVTFFVTLAFLLSLRAHEHEQARTFAWAGIAAGLAAATKYPGALSVLLPLIAVWMTPATRPSRLIAALTTFGAFLAAFLIAAPYTVLDLPGFLNGYAHLAGYYSGRELGEAPGITYLKHLRNAMHWPAFLMVVAGLILGIVRAVGGPGRVRWTLAVIFPLIYFWFISRHTLVFGRYLMPLVPFVCVLAAAAVVSGVSLLRRFDIPRAPRTALIAGLTVAALLPPAVQSVGFNMMITRTSTVEQAHAWIIENVPAGSKIAIETRVLLLTPDAYKTTNVPRLVMDSRGPSQYEEYLRQGYQYVVASSQAFGPSINAPHQYPELFKAYMTLFEQSRELVRFAPSDEHPGPEIRIFALKKAD
jgi:4-amino-4-deoxy-L-arabinose transferase-like glycosyltransferase